MAIERMQPSTSVAIAAVLENNLAVTSTGLDTWIVKDDGKYCVDGTGNDPIEEDFDDAHAAIEYFLSIVDRFE